ncbi:MAG TPA: hypothetical protein VFC15_04495 [Candidatus Limnocylindrales bacterium]|nr:hypothetical protein [Candidatus Limnocylindrales bacterium]
MNMTLAQLQNSVQFRKITPAPTTAGVTPIGQVMWLPDSLIANTNAAFETNGKTWSDLSPFSANRRSRSAIFEDSTRQLMELASENLRKCV